MKLVWIFVYFSHKKKKKKSKSRNVNLTTVLMHEFFFPQKKKIFPPKEKKPPSLILNFFHLFISFRLQLQERRNKKKNQTEYTNKCKQSTTVYQGYGRNMNCRKGCLVDEKTRDFLLLFRKQRKRT